jgi:hypothetical protein
VIPRYGRLGSAIAIAVAVVARSAAASDGDGDEARAPLPEPLLTETITDIDGSDVGEVEVEANGANLRAVRGGAFAVDASLEVEWLMTRRFGVRAEPTMSEDSWGARTTAGGVSGGASWKVFQDFRRRLYVDAEIVARLPWDSSPIIEPGDPMSPAAVDVRAGFGRGPLTLRWSAGMGVTRPDDRIPLRGSLALLAPFEESGRFGFWGVEIDADGSRRAPVVAAVEIVPNFEPAGLPLRLGLALPWTVGAAADQPSVGIFVRLFYESAREIEFGLGRGRSGKAN